MSLLLKVIKNLFQGEVEQSENNKSTSKEKFVVTPFHEQELQKHTKIVYEAFPGPNYYEWLKWFHLFIQPKTYLEIGIETGKALAFAKAPCLAVGVDPDYKIAVPFQTSTKLFKLTSDDFFEGADVEKVFEGQKIDLAFIDGLHTFDQALKDFINVERHAHQHSVILFHDVLPVIPETALRERVTYFWVGDTWKVLLILKKYRPDLRLFAIPTPHSGLGVVFGLDPQSKILSDRYDEIVAEAMEYDLNEYLPSLRTIVNTVSNDFNEVAALLNS